MGDLISRKAAIDLFKEWQPKLAINVPEFGDALQNLPSAQPERKKGEWVGADSQCGIGCPFCGTPVDDFCSSIDYIDLIYKPNFCPNCGADMRGGCQ